MLENEGKNNFRHQLRWKMQEVINKVEALLFSSGRSMNVDEISNLTKVSVEDIKKSLEELKRKYDGNESVELIQEADHWKMTVRDRYMSLVSSIVTQTELSKTLMETLAVIAFKYPIKQADLIKMRTNKAYDHLRELEELGFITRQKYGRTRLIKLAQKFFDYFDLPRDKLKEKFKDFDSLANAIEEKEEIIEKMKKERSEESKEGEKTEVVKEKEVDLVDEEGKKIKLEVIDEPEVYEEDKKIEVVEDKEKLGNLEVFDEPEQKVEEPEEEKKEKKENFEEVPQEVPEGVVDEVSENFEEDMMEKLEEKKAEEEFEKKVDKKVDELIHPPKNKEDEEVSEEEFENMGEENK